MTSDSQITDFRLLSSLRYHSDLNAANVSAYMNSDSHSSSWLLFEVESELCNAIIVLVGEYHGDYKFTMTYA